jgi:cobalamin biosynthesis protein CobT
VFDEEAINSKWTFCISAILQYSTRSNTVSKDTTKLTEKSDSSISVNSVKRVTYFCKGVKTEFIPNDVDANAPQTDGRDKQPKNDNQDCEEDYWTETEETYESDEEDKKEERTQTQSCV